MTSRNVQSLECVDRQPSIEKKKRRSLASLLNAGSSSDDVATIPPVISVEARAKKELDFYTQLGAPDEVDPLQWWSSHAKELPLLSLLARKVLTSNASSVASERLFSLAGTIVSKKRNNLKPHRVDMLAFLAFNCREEWSTWADE